MSAPQMIGGGSRGAKTDFGKSAASETGRLVRKVKMGSKAHKVAGMPGIRRRVMTPQNAELSTVFAGGMVGRGVLDDKLAQRRANGDGVSKGLLVAVAKSNGMAVLPTVVSRMQARDPFGRFASHGNDLKLVTITPKRSVTGKYVEGHGVSGLAPAHTSRSRTRPGSSMSPNGAGHGRRLT